MTEFYFFLIFFILKIFYVKYRKLSQNFVKNHHCTISIELKGMSHKF